MAAAAAGGGGTSAVGLFTNTDADNYMRRPGLRGQLLAGTSSCLTQYLLSWTFAIPGAEAQTHASIALLYSEMAKTPVALSTLHAPFAARR